ncbi:MAG: RNA-binding S4 domain-containing protein [Lachnospiraceae bacterium]|nr:RNA-binding S4 domain-containing protein [Lachnospiraceae bacterium]
MQKFVLKDEFIKLGQLLKAAGLADSGAQAKEVIEEGRVLVNGEVEVRRGRKLRGGDVAEFDGERVAVCANDGPTVTIDL